MQEQPTGKLMSGTPQGDEELHQRSSPALGMIEVHHYSRVIGSVTVDEALGLGRWTLPEADPLPAIPSPPQGRSTVPQGNPAGIRQPLGRRDMPSPWRAAKARKRTRQRRRLSRPAGRRVPDAAIEEGPGEIGIGEISPSEIRVGEVCPLEASPLEIRSAERHAHQRHPPEIVWAPTSSGGVECQQIQGRVSSWLLDVHTLPAVLSGHERGSPHVNIEEPQRSFPPSRTHHPGQVGVSQRDIRQPCTPQVCS